MDLNQVITSILEYSCKTDVSSEKSYQNLAPYRPYLLLYLCGKQIGSILTVNVKEQSNGEYISSVDYRYTHIEPIDDENGTRYFIKPVMLTKDVIHATSLVFDRDKKTVEYHDPNGIPPWYYSVLKALSSYVKIFAKGYTYIPPLCPIGIQIVERDEYCNDWNDLFTYLRCSTDEDITVSQITNEILKLPLMTLPRFLMKFRCFLTELAIELKFPALYRNILFVELFADPKIQLETEETVNRLIATGQRENVDKARELVSEVAKPYNRDPEKIRAVHYILNVYE